MPGKEDLLSTLTVVHGASRRFTVQGIRFKGLKAPVIRSPLTVVLGFEPSASSCDTLHPVPCLSNPRKTLGISATIP
jgi:hypothetical protein